MAPDPGGLCQFVPNPPLSECCMKCDYILGGHQVVFDDTVIKAVKTAPVGSRQSVGLTEFFEQWCSWKRRGDTYLNCVTVEFLCELECFSHAGFGFQKSPKGNCAMRLDTQSSAEVAVLDQTFWVDGFSDAFKHFFAAAFYPELQSGAAGRLHLEQQVAVCDNEVGHRRPRYPFVQSAFLHFRAKLQDMSLVAGKGVVVKVDMLRPKLSHALFDFVADVLGGSSPVPARIIHDMDLCAKITSEWAATRGVHLYGRFFLYEPVPVQIHVGCFVGRKQMSSGKGKRVDIDWLIGFVAMVISLPQINQTGNCVNGYSITETRYQSQEGHFVFPKYQEINRPFDKFRCLFGQGGHMDARKHDDYIG